jgi:hypothetical protein
MAEKARLHSGMRGEGCLAGVLKRKEIEVKRFVTADGLFAVTGMKTGFAAHQVSGRGVLRKAGCGADVEVGT